MNGERGTVPRFPSFWANPPLSLEGCMDRGDRLHPFGDMGNSPGDIMPPLTEVANALDGEDCHV